MINEILDLSKLDTGNLELLNEQFDLVELVESTAETFALTAHAKKLDLICRINGKIPACVIGDGNRLRQVLSNLLANAIKFTQEGSVVLTVSPSPDGKPDSFSFTVSDTGLGIPDDKQNVIFDKFVQVHPSTATKYGGSGLGLAIARQLVNLMQGNIGVKSRLGEGSIFYFDVPLQTIRQESTSTFTGTGQESLRVLAVDDNPVNAEYLASILSESGASIQVALNGRQAIEMYQNAIDLNEPFSVLVVDHYMPELDGFQLASQLQKLNKERPRVILMLTSDVRLDQIPAIKQIENLSYITKPVKRSELIRKVFAHTGDQAVPEPNFPAGVDATQLRNTVRILLADDNADNRTLVKAYLQSPYYSLDIAGDGQEALEKFKTSGYDIVLMDIQMPLMDGYKTTSAIRTFERRAERTPTPIVALTAYAHKEEVDRMYECGCSAHLAKPVKKSVLLELIGELCAPVRENKIRREKPTEQPTTGSGDAATSALHATSHNIAFCGDDAIRSLVPGYLKSMTECLSHMTSALQSGDLETIRRIAHDMKGTGVGYGFKPISDAGAAIELSIREHNQRMLVECLNLLGEYLTKASTSFGKT